MNPACPRRGGRRFAATALAAALAAGALGACAPLLIGGAVVGGSMVVTDRRTAGAQVDDEVIELKTRPRMNDAFGDRARVVATSYNRVLLLTGEIANAADKASAETIAGRVDNVRSVVNELVLGDPRYLISRSGDAFITAKVKASLIDAKDLFANSVKVVTDQGVVFLMGRVTEREAVRATDVARGVPGVLKVVRVFDVITEAELADLPKASSKP